jgi:hypothetical protein
MSLSVLAEHIESVPLVDHHVHGCWLQPPDRTRFENGLNEANTEPLASYDSAFDTQLGFAIRAHCAPLLYCRRTPTRTRTGIVDANTQSLTSHGCSSPKPGCPTG